eukprot:TRINITY_DN887_c0_g1_i6.p1 TRINITY_DN887_c0_g1~~TRINITY_DN887_c0_g1_i6.p1  ORF type:complete len:429 (+),score=156.22 TRINITY_DN887_c0_g1_i6:1201-2487(+)
MGSENGKNRAKEKKERQEAEERRSEKRRKDERHAAEERRAPRRNPFAEQLKQRAAEEERLRIEAEEKERKAAEEREQWLEHIAKPEVRDAAATRLASAWRGRDVRRANVPRKLAELQKVQQKVSNIGRTYEPRLAGPLSGNFADLPTRLLLKDALAYEEELTRALLSLDSIASGRNQLVREYRKSIVSAVNATLETLDPIKRTLIERSKQEEADRQRQEEEAAAAATAATAAAVEAVAAAAAAAADASEMESVASEAESAVSEIESAAPETAPEEPQSLSDKAHVVLERSSDAAAEVPAVAEPADISEAESSQMAVDPAEAGAVTLSEAEPMPVETPTAPQPSSSTDDWALIELDDGPNPADAAVNAPHPPMDVESDASSVDAAPSDAYANLERLSFDEIRRMLLQKDAYIRELESRVSVLQSNANLA